MSKKKVNTLDSDFDLDSGLDDFDFDFPDPNVKDDRKPTIKIGSGILQGAKESIRSTSFIKSAIKHTLPTAFGEAIDLSDSVTESIKSTYEESVRDIKPTIRQAKSIVTKLIPADTKILPKGVQKLLEDWKREQDSENSKEVSASQLRESVLANTLMDIFKTESIQNQAKDAYDDGKERLKDGIELNRHRSLLDASNRAAIALTRLDNYQTKITLKYQERSLELQYRNLFAVQDSLKYLKEDSFKRDSILLAISKNTALPEFVKLKNSELSKQVAKTKMFESVASGLYGAKHKMIEDTIRNTSKLFKDQIREATNGLREGLSGVEMGVDTVSSMSDMIGDKYVEGGKIAGDFGVSGAAKYGGQWLRKKIEGSKLDKKYGIGDKGNKISDYIENLPNKLTEMKKTNKYAWGSGPIDFMMNLAQQFIPNSGIDKKLIMDKGKDMNTPFHFTKRTDRSINEIIPGYLARIFREIQVMRTGNEKIKLLSYSHDDATFLRTDKLEKRILRSFASDNAIKGTHDKLDDIIKDIDPENKLGPAERKILKKVLLKNSTSTLESNKSRLAGERAYDGQNKESSDKVRTVMRDYMSSLEKDTTKRLAFSKKHNSLGSSIEDPRQLIQQQLDLGNIDILKKYKLINEKTGEIDLDRILDMYLNAERVNPTPIKEQAAGGFSAFIKSANQAASSFKEKATQSFSSTTDSIKTSFDKAKDVVGEKISEAAGLSAVGDLYYPGEEFPRIRSTLMLAGNYRNANGAVITKITDITDDVLDKDNLLVLSKAEIPSLRFYDQVSKSMVSVNRTGIAARLSDRIRPAIDNISHKAFHQGMLTLSKISTIDPDTPMDVFVEGEVKPRLTAIGMKAGEYRDAATDAIIKTHNDIKGEVKDAQNNLILRTEDIKKLKTFNVSLRKWSPLWIAKKALSGLWHYQTVIAPKWTKWNLEKLWAATKWAGRTALSTMGFAGRTLGIGKKPPKDVYVKGDPKPRLIGYKFLEGAYLDAQSGDRIYSQEDICGAVKDVTGQILIAEEDVDKLYTLDSIIGKFNPLKLIGMTIRGLKKLAWDYTTKVGIKVSMASLRAVGRVASSLVKFGAKTLGLRLESQDVYVNGKIDSPVLTGVAMREGRYSCNGNVITSPNDISGPVIDNETQQTVLSKEDIAAGLSTVNGTEVKISKGFLGAIKNIASKTWSGVKSVLNPKAKFKLKVAARKAPITEGEAAALKSSNTLDKILDRINAIASPKAPRKGSYEDLMSNKKKTAENEDKLADKKEKKKGMLSGLLGKIGSKALEEGGGLLSSTVGKIGSVIAGSALGTGIASAATAAGGAIVGGATAAGGALLSGAMAVGGGLLTILSSPVVLGAAALALGGYGIYRGYKYLSRGNLSKLEKIRIVQYGFMPDDENNIKKVVDFENYLSDFIIEKSGKVDLDYKKMSKDERKITSMFGLDPNNGAHTRMLFDWLHSRFQPVYLTHLTALKAISGKADISNISGLKPEDKLKYIDAVRFPEGPYDYNKLPVLDTKTKVANSADVIAALKAADDEVRGKDTVGKSKDSKADKALAIVGIGGAAAAEVAAMDTTRPGSVTNAKNKLPSLAVGVVSTVGANTILSDTNISAFDTVRFKTYGMVKLESDKVKAIRLLETEVLKNIKYDGNNVAKWSGDSIEILSKLKGSFGIADVVSKEAFDWTEWFGNRFLPIYVAYLSAVKTYLGKEIAGDPALLLKPAQLVSIAEILVGIGNVWTYIKSPWSNYVLNTSPKSTADNLNYLRSLVKEVALPEQKAPAPVPANPGTLDKAVTPPKATTISDSKTINTSVPMPDAEVEPKASGQIAKTTVGAAPSGLVLASGPLSDGRNADSFIVKDNKKVNLDNLNPAFKTQFLGMVEEYGTLTGKKTTVTSGSRTHDDQVGMYSKNPAKAAKPGQSLHEYNLAVDVDQNNLNDMDKLGLLRKYGFTRPVGGEPWHLEPIGIQSDLTKYKNDSIAAAQATAGGVGMGGGGLGSQPGSRLNTRDRDSSIAIAQASVNPTDVLTKPKLGSTTRIGNQTYSMTAIAPENKVAMATPPDRSRRAGSSSNIPSSYAGSDGEIKPSSGGLIGRVDKPSTGTIPVASNNIPADPSFKIPDPKGNGIEGLRDTIVGAAKLVGVDSNVLLAQTAMESDFNNTATPGTSSAKGIMQFTNDTWSDMMKKYGKLYGYDAQTTPPTDSKAAAIMGAHYMKDGIASLSKNTNRNIGPTEMYLSHLLGPGGAATFFKMLDTNPNALPGMVMTKAAAANRNIFYDGNRMRTVGEIYGLISSKIAAKAKAFGIALSSGISSMMPSTSTASKSTYGTGPTVIASNGARLPSTPVSTDTAIPTPEPYRRPRVNAPVMTTTSSDRSNRVSMADAYGFNTAQTTLATMPVASGGIDKSLFVNTENILSKQLDVQTQILNMLTKMANKSDTSAEEKKTENKTVSDNKPSTQDSYSYTVPKAPISMKRAHKYS